MIEAKFKFGSIEHLSESPGFITTIWRDENGKEEKRETNHYVCLGYSHCFFCGKEMSETK